MSEDDICRTCDRSRAWHDENRPQHPFRDKGDIAPMGITEKERRKALPRKTQVNTHEWPGDPILRIALMSKGILTMADIVAAEQQLREAAYNGGVIQIQPSNSGSSSGSDIPSRSGESS